MGSDRHGGPRRLTHAIRSPVSASLNEWPFRGVRSSGRGCFIPSSWIYENKLSLYDLRLQFDHLVGTGDGARQAERSPGLKPGRPCGVQPCDLSDLVPNVPAPSHRRPYAGSPRLGASCASVLHAAKRAKTGCNDFMTRPTMHIDDKRNAACVVFKSRVVETYCLWCVVKNGRLLKFEFSQI